MPSAIRNCGLLWSTSGTAWRQRLTLVRRAGDADRYWPCSWAAERVSYKQVGCGCCGGVTRRIPSGECDAPPRACGLAACLAACRCCRPRLLQRLPGQLFVA